LKLAHSHGLKIPKRRIKLWRWTTISAINSNLLNGGKK